MSAEPEEQPQTDAGEDRMAPAADLLAREAEGSWTHAVTGSVALTASGDDEDPDAPLTEDQERSVQFLEQAAGMMRSIVPPAVVQAEAERELDELAATVAAAELRLLEHTNESLKLCVDSFTSATLISDHAEVEEAAQAARAAERGAKQAALRVRLDARRQQRQTPPAAPPSSLRPPSSPSST